MTRTAAAPDPSLGPIGPFLPSRIVGRGGTGIVYAATRIDAAEHPETLAVKVLRDDLALSDRERRQFVEEADRLRRVSDPGIIGILGSGVLPDGRPYITMPLLHGETLAVRAARGALPLGEALDTFAMLARAVASLHDAGLVHRDIKPENVLLEEGTGRPVLLDFGIARDVAAGPSTTTEAGRVRGTPAYMAPERFFGTPASVATDVYELAVVLYTMLVGHLPWHEDEGASARLDPRFPGRANGAGGGVPAPIAAVVLRALSTRPEKRPASVRAFLEEIEASAKSARASATRTTSDLPNALAGTPSTSALPDVPDAPDAPSWSWARRALLGGGVAALLGTALFLGLPPRGDGAKHVAVAPAGTPERAASAAPSASAGEAPAAASAAVVAAIDTAGRDRPHPAPPALRGAARAPVVASSASPRPSGNPNASPSPSPSPSGDGDRLYRDRK